MEMREGNTGGIAKISVKEEQKERSVGEKGVEPGNGVGMWEETVNSGLRPSSSSTHE